MQLLGLISIASSWVAGLYMVLRWPQSNRVTLSRHAAATRQAYYIFASTLVLGGGAFAIFIFNWFIPALHFGPLFAALIAVAVMAQFITGLVPDTKGWMNTVHVTAAYTMAVLFIPLAILIVTSSSISTGARLICLPCLFYLIGAFCWVVLAGKAKSRYLQLQALYVVAFQLIILAATFLR